MSEQKAQSTSSDKAYASFFDDILTFLSLYERGDVQVPDPGFFPRLIVSWENNIGPLIDQIGRGRRNFETAAYSQGHIYGGYVFPLSLSSPTAGGIQVVAAREVDYFGVKRIAPLLTESIRSSARIADHPGSNPEEAMTWRHSGEVRPGIDRVVDARVVNITPDGIASLHAQSYFCRRPGELYWFPTAQEKMDFTDQGRPFGLTSLALDVAILYGVGIRTRWHVFLGFDPKMPSVGFFTDPTGVRDFFRFRDIPPGKTRRAALQHWVSQHWRQDRYQPEDEIYVREHLRGQTSFRWHGMSCQIVVPPTDLERRDNAIAARRRLSEGGLTRRLKAFRSAKSL